MADLYTYFIEKGINLLKPDGHFSYIVANKWLRANYGQPLRQWLKKQNIDELIDFGDLPVFRGATTYPCILKVIKRQADEMFNAVHVDSLQFSNLTDYITDKSYAVDQTRLDDSGWSLASQDEQNLLDKIKAIGIPLLQYVEGKVYYGIKTGLNEAFVISKEKRDEIIEVDPKSAELIKPFLAGRDVKRYKSHVAPKYIIFTRRGVKIKEYPAIENHLLAYKSKLMPKPKNFEGDWKGRKPGSYHSNSVLTCFSKKNIDCLANNVLLCKKSRKISYFSAN